MMLSVWAMQNASQRGDAPCIAPITDANDPMQLLDTSNSAL